MNDLFELTQKEFGRQRDTLNLIASENYPSPKSLSLLSSVWNTKYAEGYPGKRYYAGNILADELEEFVIKKALQVFDKSGEYGVNVQVLSGSPANAMVYFSCLESGDTVLSLDLQSGGHLSHLHPTSAYLKFFNYENYSLKLGSNGYEIDLEDYKNKIELVAPRLVIIGFSSYPKKFEFEEMCRIAHEGGALVLADISHISGLVASVNHSSPFVQDGDGADFVVTTTHKTLRGPRSALLFAKKEYMDALNKTVFPGTSGGPHLNQIAAVGQSLIEVLGEDVYPDKLPFNRYIEAVISNTKALEEGLIKSGVEVVTKTENHLVLAKLPESEDSLKIQTELEEAGIITNRNTIPGDTKSAWIPGGLRLGAAALTSRGINLEQSSQLGELIGETITKSGHKKLKEFSHNLASELAWWYEEL
jgi:glycine hydroxymethyltransferase